MVIYIPHVQYMFNKKEEAAFIERQSVFDASKVTFSLAVHSFFSHPLIFCRITLNLDAA